jgi:PTS system glucitol/sorbitol-specific IIC component
MVILALATHAADWLQQGAAVHMGGAAHLGDGARAIHLVAAQAADGAVVVAQNDPAAPAAASGGATSAADAINNYQQQVKALKPNADQLGWLGNAGTYFIGMFQKGGEVFVGFVTGIIPTLVVLMTAFYALTGLIGEERVHGFAQAMGRTALTRYTVLPVLAVFFLTNPMAYTFGTFLPEKHKPAFYDSAVSFVHPILGLFPHANAGEYFVWGGVLVALLDLEKRGVVPVGYHVKVAIWYFIVGVIVILLKGMVTERITNFMARRQGVEL